MLILVLIGAGGCSSSKATSDSSTNQEQARQKTQGDQSQERRVRNPAVQAAMEIRRLEGDQQNALTSEQKDKLKPILQDLINTSNPSQDILQQKADALNAVLTDQQKSSLTKPRTPKGNSPNSNPPSGDSSKRTAPQDGSGTGSGTGGGTGSKQAGNTMNPQVIYQQVLDSLK